MRRHPSPKHGEGGFTLVELMVIIAIVAIMLGFGYTGFTGTLERQRSQAALKRISWLLKQAQMQAIEKSTNCAVRVNAGNDTMQVFLDTFPGAGPNLTFDGNDTLIESIDLAKEYPGVKVSQGGSFRFNSRGFPKGGAFPSIKLTPKNTSLEDGNITISSMGSINVKMPESWKY